MGDYRSFLPLTPQQFHILLSLADEARHGYGIILEIAGRTGNEVRLGTGTLYTALARLEELGLIRESDYRPSSGVDDERRRYYVLTPVGRGVLKAEAARLEALVEQARRKGVHLLRPAASRHKP